MALDGVFDLIGLDIKDPFSFSFSFVCSFHIFGEKKEGWMNECLEWVVDGLID